MPRTTRSTRTPAWEARYRASIIVSSTIELTLILTHAGVAGAGGGRLALDALDQAGAHGARRHEQAVEPVDFGAYPESWLNRRVRSWPTSGSQVSSPWSVYRRAVFGW